ncbi:MAG TPA: DNA-binding response regulator [Microscillaceae bacterium]|nr:DNA-binding response regulator [Microscillaceae bacterium]
MKTLIIDDNLNAQEFLEDLLKVCGKDLTLLGKASNIREGKKLIAAWDPELVFLDVEMPDGTGFDLLQQIGDINFKVIFTTAHEKYAIKAIKYSALDYLLKPIDSNELIAAIKKVQAIEEQKLSQLKINSLLQNLGANSTQTQKIVLRDKYGLQVTTVQEIIHLEADDCYTKFFIKDQAPIVVSKPLKEYEALLPKEQFFRCHKSHLVNLDYLLRYDKKEGNMIILKNGNQVPISR